MSGSGASTRLIRRCLARNHPTPPSSSLSFKSFSTFRSELASSPQSLAMPSPTTPSLLANDVRTLATEAVVESGPTHAYNDQVSTGLIQNDDHQRSIVVQLQTMYDQLEGYTPAPLPEIRSTVPKYGFFGSFFSTTSTADPAIDSSVPKGLYLFGSVGCGKSFLMDLFYANLPAKFNGSKRRIHFHAFMMDVHQRGHRLKMEVGDKSDWIVPIARELASEARVLCFDEFQVTDIADAMILRRLMDALMGYGVVAVMTSNRHPDELYKNGIQREQFIPCIDLIKDRFKVQCLDSDIDYRKLPRALSKVYFSPISPANELEMDKLFAALTGDEEIVAHRQLQVWGRDLDIPLSTSKAAKFSFPDLCVKSLSAADYLEITKNFETVFITDVPQLSLDTKDQARRFILFIDAAYEAKTKLFVLSDPPIHSVFSVEAGSATGEISDHQRSVMDDLGLSADTIGVSSMFTGEEEVFAFARCVSRITEMGSAQWARGSATIEPVASVQAETAFEVLP